MGGVRYRYACGILSVELECSAGVRELTTRLCPQCSVSVNIKKAMWLCLQLYTLCLHYNEQECHCKRVKPLFTLTPKWHVILYIVDTLLWAQFLKCGQGLHFSALSLTQGCQGLHCVYRPPTGTHCI